MDKTGRRRMPGWPGGTGPALWFVALTMLAVVATGGPARAETSDAGTPGAVAPAAGQGDEPLATDDNDVVLPEPAPQAVAPAAGSRSLTEIWSAIRDGEAGRVTEAGLADGVLIRTGGGRTLFVGDVVREAGAWLLPLVLAGLLGVWVVRGREEVRGPGSRTPVLRFSPLDRFAHWLLTGSFIVLALTGLNLQHGGAVMVPLIGQAAFAALAQLGKSLHILAGIVFAGSLVLVAVLWLPEVLPGRLRAIRLPGLSPSGDAGGRYSPSQKATVWIVLGLGLIQILSGWLLVFPALTGAAAGLHPLVMLHGLTGIVLVAGSLVHVWYSSLRARRAIRAMTDGCVSEAHARRYNPAWQRKSQARRRAGATSGGESSGEKPGPGGPAGQSPGQ